MSRREKEPRFRLRRGSQFEGELRETAGDELADEGWLEGLRTEFDAEETANGAGGGEKRSSGWERTARSGRPTAADRHDLDDVALLAIELKRIRSRLRSAEKALADARGACAACSAALERVEALGPPYT